MAELAGLPGARLGGRLADPAATGLEAAEEAWPALGVAFDRPPGATDDVVAGGDPGGGGAPGRGRSRPPDAAGVCGRRGGGRSEAASELVPATLRERRPRAGNRYAAGRRTRRGDILPAVAIPFGA